MDLLIGIIVSKKKQEGININSLQNDFTNSMNNTRVLVTMQEFYNTYPPEFKSAYDGEDIGFDSVYNLSGATARTMITGDENQIKKVYGCIENKLINRTTSTHGVESDGKGGIKEVKFKGIRSFLNTTKDVLIRTGKKHRHKGCNIGQGLLGTIKDKNGKEIDGKIVDNEGSGGHLYVYNKFKNNKGTLLIGFEGCGPGKQGNYSSHGISGVPNDVTGSGGIKAGTIVANQLKQQLQKYEISDIDQKTISGYIKAVTDITQKGITINNEKFCDELEKIGKNYVNLHKKILEVVKEEKDRKEFFNSVFCLPTQLNQHRVDINSEKYDGKDLNIFCNKMNNEANPFKVFSSAKAFKELHTEIEHKKIGHAEIKQDQVEKAHCSIHKSFKTIKADIVQSGDTLKTSISCSNNLSMKKSQQKQ